MCAMRREWTADDIAQLMHKRDVEKKKWRVIAEEMNRKLTTCQHQWVIIKDPPAQKIRESVTVSKAPDNLIRDRDYRANLAPRDLTAAYFGDPPVGYSALDKRVSA